MPKKPSPRKKNVQDKVDPQPQIDPKMVRVLQNAQLLSRSMLGSRLGVQFGGNRDLYETFGYLRFADFQTYQNIYDRNGLGHRVIKKYANSTWNRLPVLLDGEERSDALDKGATPFLKEWAALSKRVGLTQVLRQADIMCQIGQYSILFLGASGDNYNQPTKKGDGLFYVAAYNENQSVIQQLIADPKNEKFGMPESYTVAFNEKDIGVAMPGGTNVHHTRAIHISEDRLGSRIYGTPRLQAPLNRLFDLEKVTGGGAEAAWLAVWGGMLFSTQEDIDIPSEDSEEGKFMAEQMNKYFNRMQRYAVIKGMDVNNLGTQTVNIEQIYNTLKTDFAGTVGVPQRILFGSERGELASSQDMQEWNGEIDTRRTNFAEPEILDPFIKWCVAMDVLPPPENKEWKYEWYPVYPMTKLEKATYANTLASGANTISGGVPEVAFDVNEWRAAAELSIREEVGLEDGLVEDEETDEDAELQKLFTPKKKEEEAVTKNELEVLLKQQALWYAGETRRMMEPVLNALHIDQYEQVRKNEEQRGLFRRVLDFLQRKPEPSNINVNVENYPGESPVVNVDNQFHPPVFSPTVNVEPAAVQNNIRMPAIPKPNVTVYVKPTPIKNTVNVKPANVDIKNEVKLPKVTESDIVERDAEGRAKRIRKTYQQDED